MAEVTKEKIIFEKCPVCKQRKVQESVVKSFLELLGNREKIHEVAYLFWIMVR